MIFLFMKNLQKKLALICVSALIVFFASLPIKAGATVPPLLGYGGYITFFLPCTCSITFWTWYTPLFLAAVPLTGAMAYVPETTLLFGNYVPPIVPSMPNLGAYIPGIQACWEYAGVTCFPMPVIGMIGFVGSGL
jgi:hypothetical protein